MVAADVRAAPASDVRAAPASDVRAAPATDVRAAPATDVRATPVTDVRAAPATDVRAAPATDVRAAPATDMRAAPPTDVNDPQFAQAVHTAYSDISSYVKWEDLRGMPFPVKQGVRQGVTLSVPLYKLYIHLLLEKLEESKLDLFRAVSYFVYEY